MQAIPKAIQYKNKRCEVSQRVRNVKRGYLYLIKFPQGNTYNFIMVAQKDLEHVR